MQTVKVKKVELLGKVKANRETHRAEFEKALDGYRDEAVKILNSNIERLRSNKGHVVVFSEQPPEDHTKDYDRVISMLEMSIDDVVELSANECSQFVQDDWSWKREWTTSNLKYLAK